MLERWPASALTLTRGPLDRGVLVKLDNLEHVDELVELLRHLLQGQALDAHDDRHPRDLGDLGRADSEGLDVEPTAREQARHAGENAGLVLHKDRQRMAAHLIPPCPRRAPSRAPP